ncbi:hypothetical protein K8I85_12930, partial [bacterium]|nr:hypothetical protein [bacterium]
MSLPDAVLSAPDRESACALLEKRSDKEVRELIEELAGRVLRQLRVDAQQAYRIADRAEEVTRDRTDESRARSRWVKAHALAGLLRTGEAIDCYRTAADEYRRLGRRADVARVAIGQVNALTYEGRYSEALRLGETARDTLVRTKQPLAAARLDMNLGNLHHRLERPAEALRCYDRALRAARRMDAADMIPLLRLNRATALSALGHLDEATRTYEEVAAEADASGEERVRAFVDFNLGYLRFQQGDYDRAYDTLDAARAVFERQGDDHWRTLTLIDLTELLIEVGSYTRAAAMAEAAQRITSRLGLRFEKGRATLFRAIAVLGTGNGTAAAGLLEDAAAIFEEEGNGSSRAVCDIYLGEVTLRAGDGEGAVALLRAAAERFTRERLRVHEVGARISLASALLAVGERDEARRELTLAGKRLARVASPWLRARRSHVAGRLAEAESRPADALRHYRRSIRELESIRGRLGIDEFRVSFADQRADVWADLVELVLRRDRPGAVAEAFALVEQSRSRALVDLLAGRLGTDATADPKAARLLEELASLRAEMNRLRGFSPGSHGGLRRSAGQPVAVRNCEAKITETLRRLERRSSALGALTKGETYSLDEAQDGLPAETELVEYFLGARNCWALVVSREGARAVRLPTDVRSIGRLMTRFRFQIEKCCHGSEYFRTHGALMLEGVRAHLAELAEAIWSPLGLRERRAVVVPHGVLHSLPFPALSIGGGRQVLDERVVSVVPSASCRRYVARHGRRAPSAIRVLALDAAAPDLP